MHAPRPPGEQREQRRWATLTAVLRSAITHRLPAMAGESAFFAALAVFPMLLTVVAILRTVRGVLGAGADGAAADGMTRLLRVVLTTRGSTAADAAGQLLRTSTGSVLTVGTAVAVVLMVRALRSVLHSLSVVADGRERAWTAAVALALALVAGGAVIAAVAVQDPLRLLGLPDVWTALRWPLVAAALFGWAVLVLRIGLTGHEPPGRRALLGGATVATVGWFAASAVLPLYVALVTRFTSSLGALGGGLILLLWLYLVMLSLYLGAELTQARRAEGPAPADRSPGAGGGGS